MLQEIAINAALAITLYNYIKITSLTITLVVLFQHIFPANARCHGRHIVTLTLAPIPLKLFHACFTLTIGHFVARKGAVFENKDSFTRRPAVCKIILQ